MGKITDAKYSTLKTNLLHATFWLGYDFVNNLKKMGEAKRRKTLGLPPKKNNTKTKLDESPRLFEWLPFTINQ